MSDTWISFNGNALSLNGYGLVVSGQNPYNPLNLPAYTVRFQFDDSSYDPTQVSGWKRGSAWTRVSTSPNIWDYYNSTSDFQSAVDSKFQDNQNTVHVLGANISTLYKRAKSMFAKCSSLVSVANIDLSGCTSSDDIFWRCNRLASIGSIDCSGSNRIEGMFDGCSSLIVSPYLKLKNTGTLDAGSMFYDCINLTSVTLFDTSVITNMAGLFGGCTSLTTVPLFNTSNVTNMGYMFGGCTSLTTVPLFDTSNVTTMDSMFANCLALQTVPLFNTRMVVSFNRMFSNARSLTSIPLFNTANANNMNSMFSVCWLVESGALALYQQAVSQTYPPTMYSDCFSQCGKNTDSSAPIHAELAQIPTSWGGTAT